MDPRVVLEQIEAARHGDPAGQTWIYERYFPRLHRHAYRLLLDSEDADDLVHDAFIKAFRSLRHGGFGRGGDEEIANWLYRITENVCLDVLRRRQRLRWQTWDGSKHDQLLVSTAWDDPERRAVAQETRRLVQEIMSRMTPRHRRGLELREYQGLNCYEMAEVMHLSRSAVKSLLFRAREEFRFHYYKIAKERAKERPHAETESLYDAYAPAGRRVQPRLSRVQRMARASD